MITTQTIVTLESLGVQIIQLDDEVDVHIGYLVRRFKPICVITNDTDFVVTSPDIPTTLLQIDFPWDALFHGWDPRRHDGVSARVGPAMPLVFRLFPASKLTAFLSTQVRGGEISIRELWIVASLMGNDITGTMVTRTSPKGRPYTEDILQASQRAVDAATQGPRAYGLDSAGTAAIETSVRHYERSASRTQRFSLNEDERQVYDAMVVSQRLSTSYFIAWRDAKFTIDVGNIPRLKEILVIVGHILGLESVSFMLRDAPDVAETVAVALRPTVKQRIRTPWSPETPTDPRPLAERLAALAVMFNFDPALFTAKQTLLPPSAWLILLVLQPVCDESAYRHIVETMVLVWLSEAEGVGSPAHKIIESVARWRTLRNYRPLVAAVKVGKQFAAAHCEVHSLLRLLSLDGELALPAPAELFSGSVLHYLFSFGGPLDNAALESLALDEEPFADIPRVLRAIKVGSCRTTLPPRRDGDMNLTNSFCYLPSSVVIVTE